MTTAVKRYIFLISETTSQKPPDYRADVLFLVDSSGSISVKNFETQVDFVKSLVTYLNVSAEAMRAAVLTYNDNPYLKIDFDDYRTTAQFR